MFALMHASDFSFWAWLAQIASGVAVYASQRANMTPKEELQALVLREQHPVRWAMRHPLRAVERFFRL